MHRGIRAKLLARLVLGDGDCWLFTGPLIGRDSRGAIWTGERREYAHRVSFEIATGEAVPAGLHVLHACDVPRCCNPAHLRAGTHRENMRDAVERGRHPCLKIKGEATPWHRLTEEQVREIIATGKGYGNGAALARKFGVKKSTVNNILNGRKWKHIDRADVQPAPRRAGRGGVL